MGRVEKMGKLKHYQDLVFCRHGQPYTWPDCAPSA